MTISLYALAWFVLGTYRLWKGDTANGLLMLMLGELCSIESHIRRGK